MMRCLPRPRLWTLPTEALAQAQTGQSALRPSRRPRRPWPTLLNQLGIQMDGNTVLIPNVAPDIGDSAPYNSLFTLFGQFFDHGLDLISKGGSGTVYIPLPRTIRSTSRAATPTSW